MRKILTVATVTAALVACGSGSSAFDRAAAKDLFNRSHPINALSADALKNVEKIRDDMLDQAKVWCAGGVSSVRNVVTDTRTDNSLGEVSTLVHAGCPTLWDQAVAQLDA